MLPPRSTLRRLSTLAGAALALAALITIIRLPSGSVALLLSLVLLGAAGARREFRTPSLKELAFYSIAIIAALLIQPGAHLAVSAHATTGFVTLAAFMIFFAALAVALGLLAERLFAGREDGH